MARQITTGEWGRIVANAWIDPTFAKQLSADPANAAKSFLGLAPNTDVSVFEIPPKPADLSHAQLEDIRSGKTVSAFLPAFSC